MTSKRINARNTVGGWRLCAAATCFAAASQSATALPEIQHWINDADVPVYFVHISELPMVDIELRFARSGSAHEGEKYGLASMTAGMLHQGAAGMNADEIAETFSGLGARTGASSGSDSSQTSLRSLTEPQYFDRALETWFKVFSSPDFPEEQFERRRKNVLTGIESRRQNPGAIANEAFRKAVYGDHPYGHPGSGTRETVTALTLGDLRRFHQKHYVTSNLIITMVGAISRGQAARIADRLSAALATGEPAEALPPAPALKEAVTVRIPFPSEQAHVKIGQTLVKNDHPEKHALLLGNRILGSTGFGSRLLEEIRVKRGLAYSAGSRIRLPASTGVFLVSFQTRLDQVDEAIATAHEVLNEFVASGPTEEEIELALDGIRGDSVFKTDSNGRIMAEVSSMAFHKKNLDHFRDYVRRFEKESRGSVAAAYRKHLKPGNMVTVIVGGPAE